MRGIVALMALGLMAGCAQPASNSGVLFVPRTTTAASPPKVVEPTVTKQDDRFSQFVFYVVEPRIENGSIREMVREAKVFTATNLRAGIRRTGGSSLVVAMVSVRHRSPSWLHLASARNERSEELSFVKTRTDVSCDGSSAGGYCTFIEEGTVALPFQALEASAAVGSDYRFKLFGSGGSAEIAIPASHIRALLAEPEVRQAFQRQPTRRR